MSHHSGDPGTSDGDFVHAPFSLPHGFRFSGTHGESLSRVNRGAFFVRSPTGEDAAPVPAVDSATAKTRLEVLHAWEVNFTILSLYCVSALALVYVFFALSHVRTVWFSSHVIAPAGILEKTLSPVLRTAATVLPILFVLRVVAHGQATHEQLWTGALLAVGVICTNPLTLAAERRSDNGSPHHYAALIVNDAVYTAASYLYLLLTAHSYRILDNNALHSRSLYSKKLAVIVVYFFLKLITGFGAHVVLGLVPFARILAWFILLKSGRFSARVTIPVLLTTALDALLAIWLFREVALTAQFLARTPYLEHRAKQLGFRCFVYQSLVFCVSIVVLANVATLRLPHAILYRNFDDAASNAFLQLETPAGHLGLAFVYLTWTVVLAYVNLPPGPVLPYTGHAVSGFFNSLASSAPVVWLRAQGIPVPLHTNEIYDAIPDIENPSHPEPDAVSSPLVPGDTIPLRYRHREWFVTLEEDRECSSVSPFPLAQAEAKRNAFFEQRQLDEIELERKAMEKKQNDVAIFPTHTEEGGKDHIKMDRERIEDGGEENLDTFSPGFFHFPHYRPISAASTVYDEEDGEKAEGEDADDTEERATVSVANGESTAGPVNPPNDGLAIAIPDGPSTSHSARGSYYGASDLGTLLPRQLPDRPPCFAFENRQPPVFQESFPCPPLCVRRLRLRKNLFVMETQVFLAQASYLAYIPGNAREERRVAIAGEPKPKSPQVRQSLQHTVSLSTDLEGLAGRLEEQAEQVRIRDNRSTERPIVPPLCSDSSVPELPDLDQGADPNRQPNFDDGTMFRVDPEQMARENGYVIFRQISNLESNSHATVLLGKDRVVVAFSGTRDARNWVTSTQLRRCAFDDLFPEFEYESVPESDRELHGARYPTIIVRATKAENGKDDTEQHRRRQRQKARSSRRASSTRGGSKHGSLRKSQSTDSLLHQSQHSWDSGTESTCDPGSPVSRGLALYGALGYPRMRPSKREKEPGGENGKLRRSPTQRVRVVATTIAQEFLTIGQAKVHDGFANAYLSLRKQVLGALVELYGGDTVVNGEESPSLPLAHSLPLFFCGHSLGGALATFASFEAAKYFRQIGMQNRQDISCTTFGCPMVGNDVFKARYERVVETHWRFEMASDPVPKLPSSILNYTHVGVRVLLDQSGMLLIDPSFIEVHWWGKLSNPYLGYKLHIRASYITALRLYCYLYKDGQDKLEGAFWPFPIKVQTKGVFLMSTTK